ncbi:MAG: ribulose-phosphate 3-epimerase [Bacteroidetes bacterium]|jgi:ribulose-phosphate 3-epimerase|nr:ribulose-phosphate 3-epimerase [Bacteroidota bacterium]MCK4361111.1 ribulose-phosphate 3-epimerase [Bacteroidales bacterium]MCK4406168.1 ribulose-phosphate 3-epimerase [Bacteroidales bacterium]
MNHLVAPSLLSADFANLRNDIEMVNRSEADWFHIDVMDGVFVPNISFGIPVIKQIKKYAQKPLDVHLMIIDPDRYFEKFKNAGADIISVHYEACTHLHRSIQAIKSLGLKAGVAINPHTNVNLLENIISDVDIVLVMSVNPGFGGQKFIKNTYSKIKQLKQIINKAGSSSLIEVDGGVTLSNAAGLIKAGTNVLVAGYTIFSSQNPEKTISELKTKE